MAIGDIRPEDLNELSKGAEHLGESFNKASLGAFTLTESAAGLLGVLEELGSSLDFIIRNPIISYTFIHKLGSSIQREIIQHLKEVKNLTDEQIVKWNKWAGAINLTSSAILTFATKVAYLQSQLRMSTIDLSRYFNLNALPYGTPFETVYQIQKTRALQTLQLNADFAKANVEVKQLLGRLITPAMLSQYTGVRGPLSREVYENFIKQITLYSRAYPEANIPEFIKRLYGELGGYGMTPLSAASTAMYFVRQAAYGRMVPTAGVGENINALLRIMETLQNRNISPDLAFRMAQTTLFGLGRVRGRAGEPLPLERILELASMYPGRSPEQQIITRALGVNYQRYFTPEGPLYFIQALQRWAKERGLGEKPKAEVQDIVTKALGEKMGRSYEELIKLANLPDISFKVSELNSVVKSIGDIDSTQVKALKEMVDSIKKGEPILPDRHARELEEREKRAKNLGDVISGLIDSLTTGTAKISEDLGISPLLLESLVASIIVGGAAYKGYRGLKRMRGIGKILNKIGKAADVYLGGKVVGEAAEEVSEVAAKEVMENVAKKTAAEAVEGAAKKGATKWGGKLLGKLFGLGGGIIGGITAAWTLYDIVSMMTEFSNEESLRSQREREQSRINELTKFATSTSRPFLTTQKALTATAVPSTTYVKGIYGTSLGPTTTPEEEKKKSTIYVIFTNDKGTNLGEAMADIGKETFVRIKIGEVLNSLSLR